MRLFVANGVANTSICNLHDARRVDDGWCEDEKINIKR